MSPTGRIDYAALQREAEHDGYRPVVGALILDRAGRVFVHRRGWDRSFLPSCWDIVGGDVEDGERLLDALRREVEEETGWQVAGSPSLAHVCDWEAGSGEPPRREFDFLADVVGDESRPRLEVPQHVEFRWVGSGDLDLLDENRGQDDGLVRRLVELALRSSRRGAWRFPHAMIVLGGTLGEQVERLRAAWDPAMAWQLPANATVAYPEEIPSPDELVDRARAAAAVAMPFRLRLGAIDYVDRPEDGVFIQLADVDDAWQHLRDTICDGVEQIAVEPHVTIVHPRTTNRGRQAWEQLQGTMLEGEILADEIRVSAFDGRTWKSLETLRLDD